MELSSINKLHVYIVGENKKERRLSNEAGKPVPPKPPPKEKPNVSARPTVPKRPPSVSRGNSQKEDAERRKSLDAEKRKSVEAETVPETKG